LDQRFLINIFYLVIVNQANLQQRCGTQLSGLIFPDVKHYPENNFQESSMKKGITF